jgi:hypothetical protein
LWDNKQAGQARAMRFSLWLLAFGLLALLAFDLPVCRFIGFLARQLALAVWPSCDRRL